MEILRVKPTKSHMEDPTWKTYTWKITRGKSHMENPTWKSTPDRSHQLTNDKKKVGESVSLIHSNSHNHIHGVSVSDGT